MKVLLIQAVLEVGDDTAGNAFGLDDIFVGPEIALFASDGELPLRGGGEAGGGEGVGGEIGALENDQVGQNYSAAMLPSKNNGIPTVLLDDLSFVAKYGRSNDIIDSGSGVTLRYVVDRMCRNNGQFDPQSCTTGTKIADKDSSNFLKKPPSTRTPVYRITMRVNGPRNTQSFIQSKVSYNPP